MRDTFGCTSNAVLQPRGYPSWNVHVDLGALAFGEFRSQSLAQLNFNWQI